jgi:fructosamine-3-kinase
MINNSLLEQLSYISGESLQNALFTPIYGGDTNDSYQLKTENVSWFIKLNDDESEAMFAAEAEGLKALTDTQTITIPQVIMSGKVDQQAYLLLEYLDLQACDVNAEKRLGQQLAQLHRKKQPYYGWPINNTIGKTLQLNQSNNHWVTFWQQQRLAQQLTWAAEKGYTGKLQTQGNKLCADIGHFFSSYQPQASLVHGDLWAGNVAADPNGNPVIFDPACYYGDREVDIAMTELFGGFSDHFYTAYQQAWPLDQGYAVRKILYNLYHSLNHLNLFGQRYENQSLSMIEQLLAEL